MDAAAAAVAGKADMPDRAVVHWPGWLGCRVVERSVVEAHVLVGTDRLVVSSTCLWAIQSSLFSGDLEARPDHFYFAAAGSAAPVLAAAASKLRTVESEQLAVDLAAAGTELRDKSGDCQLATHSRSLLILEGFRCSGCECCSA